jgi:hypothetical protein
MGCSVTALTIQILDDERVAYVATVRVRSTHLSAADNITD